jgi:hypothetical protein
MVGSFGYNNEKTMTMTKTTKSLNLCRQCWVIAGYNNEQTMTTSMTTRSSKLKR